MTKNLLAPLNAVVEPLARSGWVAPPPIGLGLVLLETSGRRSGATRRRPLLAARVGEHVLTGTIRSRSDWVANVRASATSTLWARGGEQRVRAEVRRLPLGSVTSLRAAID
jgi:hypothetical protein